ncbi:hypothetical protein [Paraburkholderia sp. PGU19]|uniref:hypothetical protein n=1 Tax=Paraburkholderia sp. PGU19 TaxID=2735434 RepID=UPI0015DB4626|nr:hypothetical protein [Paraburkholderia sp. PGU19]
MLGVLIRLVAGRNARTFSHASGVQPVLREKFVAEVDRYLMAFHLRHPRQNEGALITIAIKISPE